MSTSTVGLLSSTDHAMILAAMKPSFIPSSFSSSSSSSTFRSCLSVSLSPRRVSSFNTATRRRRISCEVAIRSDSATSSPSDLSESPSSSPATSDDETGGARIGARVRVKVPLKVYHVPKVPEIDIMGMEGELKQYVGLWKGKRISANLPYKVQFVTEVEGRGPVKFFAHLRDDEFEYL